MKFSIRFLYGKSSGESEFGKIQLSDSYALLKGVDEVLSVFPLFVLTNMAQILYRKSLLNAAEHL